MHTPQQALQHVHVLHTHQHTHSADRARHKRVPAIVPPPDLPRAQAHHNRMDSHNRPRTDTRTAHALTTRALYHQQKEPLAGGASQSNGGGAKGPLMSAPWSDSAVSPPSTMDASIAPSSFSCKDAYWLRTV